MIKRAESTGNIDLRYEQIDRKTWSKKKLKIKLKTQCTKKEKWSVFLEQRFCDIFFTIFFFYFFVETIINKTNQRLKWKILILNIFNLQNKKFCGRKLSYYWLCSLYSFNQKWRGNVIFLCIFIYYFKKIGAYRIANFFKFCNVFS